MGRGFTAQGLGLRVFGLGLAVERSGLNRTVWNRGDVAGKNLAPV